MIKTVKTINYRQKSSLKKSKMLLLGMLVGFYGISTFVGYLMPDHFYTNNQFYFKPFILV